MGCKAKIVIKDEVNVRVKGIDPDTMEACQKALTFHVPGYFHMPAYKLGRWDGTIKLFRLTGATYFNLLDEIIPILKAHRCSVEFEDLRPDYDHIAEGLKFIKEDSYNTFELKGQPCILRDYQVDAVNTALENSQGILEMATGSGKTLVCGIISKIFSEFGNVVVIVPNIDLIIQTQYEFKSLGIEAGVWYGEIKDRKEVTIATWQSLDHFPELFNDVVCVIVDEVHQAKAKVLNEMLSGPGAHVPYRFGCTGTMPKEKLFRYQIRGVLGNTIFEIKSWELQNRGVLAASNTYQIRLGDSNNPDFDEATMVEVENEETGEISDEYEGFESWKEEVDWQFKQHNRVDYVASLIRDIAQDHGNTLVLVTYRKHGKLLEQLIPGSISLDGRDKGRKEFYEEFNAGDNQVLICTYGIASIGIDITRIFNLVFIEPGKKFEKVMQTIGRGLRKGQDKHELRIYDICSDSGISRSHSAKRRTLYRQAKQKFEIIDVEYIDADTIS